MKNDIIRVYFGSDDRDWIEFGVYDFDSLEDVCKRVERVLGPKILTMGVASMRCDIENGKIEIYLNQKTEGGIDE